MLSNIDRKEVFEALGQLSEAALAIQKDPVGFKKAVTVAQKVLEETKEHAAKAAEAEAKATTTLVKLEAAEKRATGAQEKLRQEKEVFKQDKTNFNIQREAANTALQEDEAELREAQKLTDDIRKKLEVKQATLEKKIKKAEAAEAAAQKREQQHADALKRMQAAMSGN